MLWSSFSMWCDDDDDDDVSCWKFRVHYSDCDAPTTTLVNDENFHVANDYRSHHCRCLHHILQCQSKHRKVVSSLHLENCQKLNEYRSIRYRRCSIENAYACFCGECVERPPRVKLRWLKMPSMRGTFATWSGDGIWESELALGELHFTHWESHVTPTFSTESFPDPRSNRIHSFFLFCSLLITIKISFHWSIVIGTEKQLHEIFKFSLWILRTSLNRNRRIVALWSPPLSNSSSSNCRLVHNFDRDTHRFSPPLFLHSFVWYFYNSSPSWVLHTPIKKVSATLV